MKKLSAIFAALSLASMLSGCVTIRRITAINEHPAQPMLFLETEDRQQFLWQTVQVQHVFWQCVERNGTLACQRQCGLANQDFSCPTAAATIGGVSTNVR
jgi:hypothetical protein